MQTEGFDWLTFAAFAGPIVAFLVGVLTQIRGVRADRASARNEETANLFETWGEVTERLRGEVERLSAAVERLRVERDRLKSRIRVLEDTIEALKQEIAPK